MTGGLGGGESLRPGRHLEDDDIVPELARIHPRERPDWEETISAMARSAEIPELRTEVLMRSSSSSTASMKVKNVKRLSFTKGHFPKLAECAHFHYENVDFEPLNLHSCSGLIYLHVVEKLCLKWKDVGCKLM
uniref:Rho-GAP domain-containing protein n=1 Tax=Kryptolebias marmoratus TaxID=37003 RepID=A0A3Q3AQ11_KRYMA